MLVKLGSKVVYPHYGPCSVGAVVTKEYGGQQISFYPLTVMDDSGDVLFVPIDKMDSFGIRTLMEASDVAALLNRLSRDLDSGVLSAADLDWKRRAADNAELLASGTAHDLVLIVGSLTKLNEKKALSPRDRQVFDKAKRNLICEIAEALGAAKSVAAAHLEAALKTTATLLDPEPEAENGEQFTPGNLVDRPARPRVSLRG